MKKLIKCIFLKLRKINMYYISTQQRLECLSYTASTIIKCICRAKIFSLIKNFLTFVAASFYASHTNVLTINYKTIYHNIRTIISQ